MMTIFFVGGIQGSRAIRVDERPRTVAVPDICHVIVVDMINTSNPSHDSFFFTNRMHSFDRRYTYQIHLYICKSDRSNGLTILVFLYSNITIIFMYLNVVTRE
jgi:hypothetical protein